MSFNFLPLNKPRLWEGRYSRIPGREPAFHVSVEGKITLRQRSSDEALTHPLVPCAAAGSLGKVLNDTKKRFSGYAGGSFVINEFGQVITPIQGCSDRYLTGTVTGVPTFKDARHPGQTFSLEAPEKAEPGTLWIYPYVGTPFTLRLNGRVAFEQGDAESRRWVYPDRQDVALIAKFQQVRGSGIAVRFIVNLHGVVLTKLNSSGTWNRVFISVIDPNHWFRKEN